MCKLTFKHVSIELNDTDEIPFFLERIYFKPIYKKELEIETNMPTFPERFPMNKSWRRYKKNLQILFR